MEDVIEIGGRYYVPATSSRVDDRTRVLKHGDSFAVFDRYGDVQVVTAHQGLFHEGTRYVSRFELLLDGKRPVLLNSTATHDNTLLTVDLTNPELRAREPGQIRAGTVHVFRAKSLWRDVCYEHVRVGNYGDQGIGFRLDFEYAADYADLFEVRGTPRERKGEFLAPRLGERTVTLGYVGLDRVTRYTTIEFNRTPKAIGADRATFEFFLQPLQQVELYVFIHFGRGAPIVPMLSYDTVLRDATRALAESRRHDCTVITSNEPFNAWLDRSQADIHMLVTYTDNGPYPYAGIPWFSTPFGRDGIITALEYLWVNPDIARGVLGYIAAHQAKIHNPAQEAEPGKVFHETRHGEMAALGEIPYGLYYGTVDATPLFLMLATAYHDITGDTEYITSIWSNIEAALHWIDAYGDADDDGFIEYMCRNPRGLVHQGWKDSDDSVFHADGRSAHGHIALCEVQGYVYAGKLGAATLAQRLGKTTLARELTQQAADLRERFNRVFWCDDIATYAIALDGDKQPCRVRSSNAGHALWTGIAKAEYVAKLANSLLSEPSFSGWGVRTIAETEARYNPISYHNGSVWPHDNALIGLGLARYGRRDGALTILNGLFDASLHMDLHRLPELFCGFVRRPDQGPTLYPTSCIPQAWASAAVFGLLQACLGMRFHPTAPHLVFDHPKLPPYLNELEIRNLRLATGKVDLALRRHREGVGVDITSKQGDVDIVVRV